MLKNNDTNIYFPSEVVEMFLRQKYSLLKAWREYLKFTQDDIATKANISLLIYQKFENSSRLTDEQITQFSEILGIDKEQLYLE